MKRFVVWIVISIFGSLVQSGNSEPYTKSFAIVSSEILPASTLVSEKDDPYLTIRSGSNMAKVLVLRCRTSISHLKEVVSVDDAKTAHEDRLRTTLSDVLATAKDTGMQSPMWYAEAKDFVVETDKSKTYVATGFCIGSDLLPRRFGDVLVAFGDGRAMVHFDIAFCLGKDEEPTAIVSESLNMRSKTQPTPVDTPRLQDVGELAAARLAPTAAKIVADGWVFGSEEIGFIREVLVKSGGLELPGFHVSAPYKSHAEPQKVVEKYGKPDEITEGAIGTGRGVMGVPTMEDVTVYWYGPLGIGVSKGKEEIIGVFARDKPKGFWKALAPDDLVPSFALVIPSSSLIEARRQIREHFKSQADFTESLDKTPGNKPGLDESLLPAFSIELQGQNEVRIRNPNDFYVLAGVRSGTKGKNLTIPPNSRSSIYVPDGRYDILFVYSSEPGALFQGDSFTLNGNGVEIQIVKVVNGNYGIRRVK